MRKSLLGLVFILSTTPVFAKNIWVDCGIGAMIFTNTGWAAVTSNVTWDLGTTGTTSNVSSEDQCAGKSASVAKYIHQNYAQIEENTAKGNGAYLTSMLDMVSCDEASRSLIIKETRSNLNSILKTKGYTGKTSVQKAELYYNSFINNIEVNHSNKCQTT
jgi:hypothetical protein